MLKIGIDARCLTGGKRTGIEEYFLNLLPELFELDRENEYILFFNSFKSSSVDFSWIERFSNVSLKTFHLPNKLLNFSLWYLGFPKLDRLLGGVDVFFMPNLTFVALSQNTRLVLSIHDLSFERYPEFFSLKRRLWHFLVNPGKICRRAEKITAVSESTRKDLMSIYGIDQNKISLVPNGISERFRIIDRNDRKLITIKEKYDLPYKFILFLGTLEPRKNIASLVRAFNHLKKAGSQKKSDEIGRYKLVLAGGTGWLFKDLLEEIEKSPFRKDISVLGQIPDEDKEYLYNLASIFVFPSFFEGFGIPPLEATACGIPTVISNTSSLPDVVGDSSIMIDPDRPTQIAKTLEEIILDQDLRTHLREKLSLPNRKFSWKKSAKKLQEILASPK